MTFSKAEEYPVEPNSRMLERARELASKAEASEQVLPTEIEGFSGFFVAHADDQSVAAMYAFVIGHRSFKIGDRK